MGQAETKYRITSTKTKATEKGWDYWEGMCAVVHLKEKVQFANGEEYEYIKFNNGLRITEGPHKGFYELESI